MRAFLTGIPLVLVLGGCIAVVPPAVTIASYAIDGVSLLVSGKSVTDHAVSEIAGEDCALWRMMTLSAPCRPWEDTDSPVLVADAGGAAGSGLPARRREPTPAATFRTDDLAPVATVFPAPLALVDSAGSVAPAGDVPLADARLLDTAPAPTAPADTGLLLAALAVQPAAGPAAAASVPVETGDIVAAATAVILPDAPVLPDTRVAPEARVVLGSFTSPVRAGNLAAAWRSLDPEISQRADGARIWYRVVTPSQPLGEARDLRARIAAAGIADAWLLPVAPVAPAAAVAPVAAVAATDPAGGG